jgi:hypothetical protein
MSERAPIHPAVLYSIADIAEGACMRCHASQKPAVASGHRMVMDEQFSLLRKLYARRNVSVGPTIRAMKQTCTDCMAEGKLEPVFALRVGCIIRGGLE